MRRRCRFAWLLVASTLIACRPNSDVVAEDSGGTSHAQTGSGSETDGSSSSSDTTDTTSEGTDTSQTDDMASTDETGDAEHCAVLDEAECGDDSLCWRVRGRQPIMVIPGVSYCLNVPHDYLGCIAREDQGCGVDWVCKDGEYWDINPNTDCVPPGYEACDGPGGKEDVPC